MSPIMLQKRLTMQKESEKGLAKNCRGLYLMWLHGHQCGDLEEHILDLH